METGLEKIRKLKDLYYTERDNLSDDFFAPCLNFFQKYDRAAGYFSSSALRHWAANITRLTKDENVSIRLLISPKISEADYKAFRDAVSEEKRKEILAEGGTRFLAEAILWESGEVQPTEKEFGKILAWLIAQERLEVRFAFSLSGGAEAGIFHKKIGIFTFPWGDKVAFTGSANETRSGHSVNSESIDVYRSWDFRDENRIAGKLDEFSASWDPNPDKLFVLKLSESVLEKVRSYSQGNPPDFFSLKKLMPRNVPSQGESPLSELWPNQAKAFKQFLAKKNGVLEMATGTGKTRTAIAILSHLYQDREIESIVVTMAGNDLLAQWESDLRKRLTSKLGLTLLTTLGGKSGEEHFIMNPRGKVLLCPRGKLLKVLEEFRRNSPEIAIAIVHDEVHDLGSPANVKGLEGHKEFFEYRLGLSATPEREYDDSGNDFIEQEVGPILFRYTVESAIKDGILCPFDYFPISYQLTSEDRSDLKKVYARESAAAAEGNPWPRERRWMELSRVYKRAREKPSAFASFLKDHEEGEFLKSTIIFVEDKEFGERIYDTLIRYTHLYSQYFDSDDSSVLKRFAIGELDCLVTCHKISQGIDVPSLGNVVLFSSQKSRRETIQRLGRCLRSDPSNPGKIARVVDFVFTDSSGYPLDDSIDSDRVDWLTQLSKVRPVSDDHHS
ncbi:MAG: DEAD/DEAH box helicase family protein [Verrucomicrobiales bacterium]|nr:DEAD/DEAH box helicase family protein [Verrucomicrobiales bacterium]